MTPHPPLQSIDAPSLHGDVAPRDAFWCGMVVGGEGVSPTVPHVNNAEYVRWIDRAAELAIDVVGYTRERMHREHRMWFVVRHEISYRAETFEGDRVAIATWVSDYSRTTSLRETRIVRVDDGRRILDATTRWAFIDLDRRRPVRIPGELIKLVPVFAAP